MHPAAEVSPLGNGAASRQLDHRHVVDAAFFNGPVAGGLSGVRQELEHADGNEAEQNYGEEDDVVDAVLGFHPGDEGWTPAVVLGRRTHNGINDLLSLQSRTGEVLG